MHADEQDRGRNGYCGSCRFAVPVYMGDGEDLMTACVYILRTGKKRPCPPGGACTVREPAEPEEYRNMQRKRIKSDIYSEINRSFG